MRSATRASLGLWFLSSEQEQPRDVCPAHTAAAHWVLLPPPVSLPRAPWTRLSQDWPLLCRLREPGVDTAEGRPESPRTLWVAAVPSAAEQGPVQGWRRQGRPGPHGRSRGHSGAGHRACSVGGRAGSQSQGPWNKIVVKNVRAPGAVTVGAGRKPQRGGCTRCPWCRGSAGRGPPREAAAFAACCALWPCW